MKNVLIVAAILLISPFFMAHSCNHNSCEGVICTAIFKAVTVQVNDAGGEPVTLDEAYTIRVRNNEKIVLEQNMGAGMYYVLDDSFQKQLANKTEQFIFTGFRNGVKVVEETYTISADCCHIDKESGKDVVTVQ